MKGNGKINSSTDMEFNDGKMAIDIRGSGTRAKRTGMANFIMLMVTSMKVNG